MSSSSGARTMPATAGTSLVRDTIFAALPPRARDWALMAVAGLLAAAIKGYGYGYNDQALLLPFVKHTLNPSLYPGDILLESARTMQPIFWTVIGRAAQVVPLPALVLTLHVVSSALSLIGVWALAVSLFRNRTSANIGLLVLALSVPTAYALGLDPPRLIWPELVQRSVIFPLLLFALVLSLHRRLVLAMILVGLSVNIHPVSSGTVGLMILLGALFDRDARRSLPPASLAAAICAAPMVVGMAMRPGAVGTTAAESEQWLRLLRLRVSHHMFPLTWDSERWLGALLVLAIGLRSYLVVGLREMRHRTALVWFAVPLALWVPGFIFTEVWPVPAIIMMQFFRGTKFAMMIGLLYFTHHQVLRLSSGRTPQVLVGLLSVAAIPVMWTAPLAAPAVVLIPHMLVRGVLEDTRRAGRWPLRLAAAVLVLALGAGAVMAVRQRSGADWLSVWGGMPEQWRGVQVWVKEHSATDTTVLIPPLERGFRVFSERPVVGVLKDGGLHQNNPRLLSEWWRRMQDLGCREDGPTTIRCRNFREFSADELARLGRRYDADLLVTYRDHDLPWEPLYVNNHWAVYHLPGGRIAESTAN